MDELDDICEIDLHISGCINSCGHHQGGHTGILDVDKDGKEWYEITLGGADGEESCGVAQLGKVIKPSFSAGEIPDVIEVTLETYRDCGISGGTRETLIQTLRRIGLEPFKVAANGVRWKAQASL